VYSLEPNRQELWNEWGHFTMAPILLVNPGDHPTAGAYDISPVPHATGTGFLTMFDLEGS